MKFKVIKIPVQEPDVLLSELNAFCENHSIASVEKHFVPEGSSSFWAFCVSYLEQAGQTSKVNRKEKIDYREVLAEADFQIFSKLRKLRKDMAEEEGVPVYALFTNEQLAEMVRRRVVQPTAMGQIEGIGKSRMNKYGAAFLHADSGSWRKQYLSKKHSLQV